MKIIILLVAFLLTTNLIFAAERTDTTFTYDLNDDNFRENIKITGNENDGTILLEINDSKFSYESVTVSESEASVIKINNRSYLIISNTDYYGYESVLFSYDKKIDSIGTFWSLDKPEVNIKGIIKVNNWLGFWSADFEYHLENNRLIEKYKDEYVMPDNFNEYTIMTTEKIFVHSDKSLNSKGLYEIKPKTQIFILKADIRNKCKEDDDNWAEGCNWYFIKSTEGTQGWIMLKDFQYNVEGIPWAG